MIAISYKRRYKSKFTESKKIILEGSKNRRKTRNRIFLYKFSFTFLLYNYLITTNQGNGEKFNRKRN